MRPSLRYRNPSFEHPLMRAAAESDLDRLKEQADFGADLSQLNEHGSVPLVACVRGQKPDRIAALRWMIERGASVNHTDADSNSPLHHACYLGDAVAARLLLEHGAELGHDNDDHLAPLAVAAAAAHWPLAELCIDHGAELNPTHGIPPLHAAAMLGQDDRRGAEMLIKRGAEVNFRGKLGRTALMGAAMRGNALVAELLLKSGADINARDDFGNTALMEAARSGANEVLERFVFWHPDTGYRDKPGRTALLVAVSSRRADPETVRLLLAMGADPHVRNREGREAGDLASAAGRWRIAKALGYEPVIGRSTEAGALTATQALSRIESEDEPVVVDIGAFATRADQSWAKRQLRARGRTELQAATPVLAAAEETARQSAPPAPPSDEPDHSRSDAAAAPAEASPEPPPRFELVPENLAVPTAAPAADGEATSTEPGSEPAETSEPEAEPERGPDQPAVVAEHKAPLEPDQVETKTESASELESARTAPETEPASEPELLQTESEIESVSEPETVQPESSTESASEPELVQPEPAPEPELVQPEPETESAPEPELVEPGPETESASEPELVAPQPEPEPTSEPKLVQTEPEPEPQPESVGTEPEPEAQPEPAPEPETAAPVQAAATGEEAEPHPDAMAAEEAPAGIELDAVVDLDEPDAQAVKAMEAGSEEDIVAPPPTPDRQLGYRALIEAATGDDIDQMNLVMLSQDEVPEWWLAAAFLNSVAHGRVIAPRWLLDQGLSASASGESGQPLLSSVVQQWPLPVDTIELLLDRGARVDPQGQHLLWVSGYADHQHDAGEETDADVLAQLTALVPRLVDGGASPDARDALGRVPLHWAVRYRGVKYLTALLDAGADVNAQDEGGNSALMHALEAERSCQMGLIRVLIKRGADPRRANAEGVSPMTRASASGDETVLKLLMLGGPGAPTAPRAEHRDSLVEAAAQGNLGRVKRLLASRMDVNRRDAEGCTALLRAAGSGHSHVVSALIAAGADPNRAARNGTTPLGAAVLAHHLEMVRLLIERGVPVDQPQQFGITPLMLAAARWHPRMVRLLLKLGAEIDRRDEAEGTALMAAAQNAMFSSHLRKGEDTLNVLLGAGADVNAANDEGQSALMLLLGVRARETRPVDGAVLVPLVRLLLEAGADTDAQDFTGWSALHAAAAHGFLEPTRELLTAGANKRLRDINGLSPSDLAMDHAHDRLVDLFLAAD